MTTLVDDAPGRTLDETAPGRVVLVVGTSSVGKSSAIRELQELLPSTTWRWELALAELPHSIVRLRADLAALEHRECERGNSPGLARGHLQDNLIDRYDLDVDTTELSPAAVAKRLAAYLMANHSRPATG